MKYIQVKQEQIPQLYNDGVQLLYGAVPCSSLEQALNNPDKIYVRPRMTAERFAEYVRVRTELEKLQELKSEIEADIQADGEIAFFGSKSKTDTIELGGFNLEMTRSDRVQLGNNEAKLAYDLLKGNEDYITQKTIYIPTSTLKTVLVILHTRAYSDSPLKESVSEIYQTYLTMMEEKKAQGIKVGRKTEESTFLKSLAGTPAKRKKFLESKGFESDYAQHVSAALDAELNRESVMKLLSALGVTDVSDSEVQQLLEQFAINTVTSFNIRW